MFFSRKTGISLDITEWDMHVQTVGCASLTYHKMTVLFPPLFPNEVYPFLFLTPFHLKADFV